MRTDLVPSSDQLLGAPELAILHALNAALAAAHRALLAAHPELEEDLWREVPLRLDGAGWIADAILTNIDGLERSIARYQREIARSRRLALTSIPF